MALFPQPLKSRPKKNCFHRGCKLPISQKTILRLISDRPYRTEALSCSTPAQDCAAVVLPPQYTKTVCRGSSRHVLFLHSPFRENGRRLFYSTTRRPATPAGRTVTKLLAAERNAKARGEDSGPFEGPRGHNAAGCRGISIEAPTEQSAALPPEQPSQPAWPA
jgi:hypothetical protein